MKLPGILLIALACSSCGAQVGLNVVPAVRSWTPAEGTFCAKNAAVVVSSTQTNALWATADKFCHDLTTPGSRTHRLGVREAAAGGAAFVLALDSSLPAEGYRVEIAGQVTIRGGTAAGVFYGTRTVLQLLAQHAVEQLLPKGVIADWPQYRQRMLMVDVGRKPFPMPVLEDYLRIMSWYKMNELHLHLSDDTFGEKYSGFRVQCDTFPGLASKDLFYTRKDLRDLQDTARRMGITITPEIDMPGHALCFTEYWPDLRLKGYPSYLDVTNPQTAERLKKLLDEIIPLFDAPDFHIGTDEYRVEGSKEEKAKLHEAFRQFINTMSAHIRSKGKTTRIWSGFEHMAGTTQIDPSITIDMWETDDAKGQIAVGHKIINSYHYRTYIVPGAHYYGVNNAAIYDTWEPWMVSKDTAKNPDKDDPNLLGGKLHVWNDLGPTGYTLNEIARLTLPSLQAFAEKLWGTKGSPSYAEFQSRAALTEPVPGVTVLNRVPVKNADGLVLDLPQEQTLSGVDASIPLPCAGQSRADLEYPWTLTMEVCPTGDTGNRDVILSSDLVEVCADFTRQEEVKQRDAAGKEVTTKTTRQGIGLVRAAGSPGPDPASSMKVNQVSHVYGDVPPFRQWTKLTLIGECGQTTLFINGRQSGRHNDQMLCPLDQLGSKTGNSFVGKIRRLKVYNRAFSAQEVEHQQP